MALLEDIRMTGSLGNLSFYYMRGVDKIVVRTKGGPSREYVEKSPTFAVPRLNMSEFGGCSKMGKEVRLMMHPVRNLADYNFSGFINKALKLIQKQDGISELGRRSISLSKHPHLLAGFQLNKTTTFDAVIRTPVTYAIHRENLSAQVNIPALVRDINFNPNNRHARFRIEATLGIVPDFTFNTNTNKFQPPTWYTGMFAPKKVSSPWYPALKGSPATSLTLQLTDQIPADEGYSLMLTVGVRYGSPMEDDVVQEVKRAGVGKVVAVAGQSDDTPPENKTTPDNRAFSATPGAVTPCTYGWHVPAPVTPPAAVQPSGHPVTAETPAHAQEETELLVEKNEAPEATTEQGPHHTVDWLHAGRSQ
jgi:hypothetical protein